MSGKQRKFRVKTSGGDEEDVAAPKENAEAPPLPKPSSAIAKPSLLSFDEDSGDDGPSSIAPKKKSISIDKDKKPKLGRAPPLTVPESAPVVGTTQRSSAGETRQDELKHMGLGRHG